MNTMGKFSLSANIENGFPKGFKYIVTPNAQKAIANISSSFKAGIHSFTIIGTYGTGKTSFLLAFESDILQKRRIPFLFLPKEAFKSFQVEIVKIIGDYCELSVLLAQKLNLDPNANVLDALRDYYDGLERQGKLLVIIIDEFGKILEHAAKNNPEKEFYFLQKFAEFVNNTDRQILLITTLHQNFGAYSKQLSEEQKFEWMKVKGRFHEITFVEPIEQILALVAKKNLLNLKSESRRNFQKLISLAKRSHFLSDDFSDEVAGNLYPMDPFSAFAIASSIQKYGQNERSLFSFLAAKGDGSVADFEPSSNRLYNLLMVFDYITYHYHSQLSEANVDSMTWRAIRVSIERAESQKWTDNFELATATNLLKVIGLLNIVCSAGFRFDKNDLSEYAKLAMGIDNAHVIINELIKKKIVRYAAYKERLVLFEGTDVDIESEVINARLIVPHSSNFVDELRVHINSRISPVKAHYYQKGTPRYFDYYICEEPIEIIPKGDTDGYVELIFSTRKNALNKIREFSQNCDHALVFAFFKNSKEIEEHLYNISIYQYIFNHVEDSDYVAKTEIDKLKEHEERLLNATISANLFSYNDQVVWIFKGEERQIKSHRDFNTLLSEVCNSVYHQTPVMNNELFNRHTLSSSIASAKAKYFQALLENGEKNDLGFESTKFPPEKTIYYSLLKNTGLHSNGTFTDEPSEDIASVWNACEDFLHSTKERPKKLSELLNILSSQPYKLKDGFIEFWLPTYLFMKRSEYSLYGEQDQFIPSFSIELLDLMKKHIGNFKVKAFDVDGIKMQLFNQYRRFLNLSDNTEINSQAFLETIKPFLFFYNKQLNEYAKHTQMVSHRETIRFRDVLAKAKDPEKAFLEDLPTALGYTDDMLRDSAFVQDYCNVIQRAVRELRCCYSQLIDRLENTLIEKLGLSSGEYAEYVQEIRQRLAMVKPNLLTPRQKDFYQHAISCFDNRTEWYQSICFSVLEAPLEKLKDSQEPKLHDDLVFLFRECEQVGVLSESINYRIDEHEEQKSLNLEERINGILSGDTNLDVFTLMRMLQKRINHE